MTQFSWKVLASTSDFVHFFGAFSAEFFSLFFTYRVFQEMVLHPVNGSLRMCLSMYLSIYVYLEHLRLFQQLPHQMGALLGDKQQFFIKKICQINIRSKSSDRKINMILSSKQSALKFLYSEKAPKFCDISTNYLSYVLPVK